MDYFPHDTHAMSDDKLLALRIEKGLEAVACYWVVLEKIYSDERPFDVSETNVGSSMEARSVSYKLGVGFDALRDYVFAMERAGLLRRVDCDGDVFMSDRAQAQIDELDRKRETARQNGKGGGRKPSRNQRRKPRGTDVGSGGKPKSGDIKTLNGIGFDKQNQIPASGDAAAGEPAPPSAFKCPTCGVDMERTNMRVSGTQRRIWRCPLCAEEVPE